jgi:geranylgeranylglycerol-phosphate geranylgeranyltransferase
MKKILLKISSFIIISRPLNFFITFFSVIVSAVICLTDEYSAREIMFAALSASLIASSGYVINDYFDIEADKLNHPERPLVRVKLTKNQSLYYYFILIIVSLFFSIQINSFAFLISIIAAILLFLYSYKLKEIILIGNILVSVLTGMVFIYGGAAVDNFSYAVIPALFAFLINLIREVVKDMEDSDGDLQANVITYPLKYGFNPAKKFIFLISIFLILFTMYPFFIRLYRIEYFIFVMVIVNPVLVFVIKSLYENDSRKNLNKLSFLLKLDMLIGLIAIYLGK